MAIRNFITTENRTNLFNINNPTYIKKIVYDNDARKSKISKGIISSGGLKGNFSGQGFIIDIHNAEYITFSCMPIAVNNGTIEYNFTDEITNVISPGYDNINNKKPILVNERYFETINNANKRRYFVFYLYDLVQYEFKIKEVQIEIGDKLSPYTEYCGRTSFKKMIKVGDITQLVVKDNIPATKTQQGITFTNNGDGSVTANGVSTNKYYSEIDIRIGDTYQKQEDNHKYLLLSGLSPNAGSKIECILWVGRPAGQPGNAYNAADIVPSAFSFTIPKGQYVIKSVKCRIRSGYTAENVTFIPQLFDLTEMYGAGNEPSTVAEFRERFPDNYYPYQRSWLTYYNDKLVVDGKEV